MSAALFDIRHFTGETCLMLKALIILIIAFAGAAAAQTYTVSSGSLTYTPLSPATATQLAIASIGNASQAVSPPGFTFNLFGVGVSSFEVSRFGRIRMQGSGISNKAYNDYVSDFVIAPCWGPTVEAGVGVALWEFQAGVLVVEWQDFEWQGQTGGTTSPIVSFQLRLDTASGEIEFRYAPITGTSTPVVGNGSVCLTGAISAGSAMPICFGETSPFVDASGAITQWPADSFIRFTPATGGNPSITATLNHSQYGTPLPGDLLYVKDGTKLSSLNLQIAVGDPDGDPVSLTGTINNSGWVPDNLVDAEFSSATGATPYMVSPTSGQIDNGNVLGVMLLADDGAQKSVLYFTLQGEAPPAKKKNLGDSLKTFKISHCSVSPGGGWVSLAPLALLAVWSRRRKTWKS